MIPTLPTIGVRFDIKKVIDEGSYGTACWKTFWRAIMPDQIPNSSLFEGDTNATLNGKENVFCIAVQSSDAGNIKLIKTALGLSAEFLAVSSMPAFLEGSSCTREPLPDAGKIDDSGNLVGSAGGSRSALGSVRREREASLPNQAPSSVPSKSGPASERTTDLPDVASFEEIRLLVKNRFTPPEYGKGLGTQYWLTPEELSDIADRYSHMTLIGYKQYSCGSTEDMCCVGLFERKPTGKNPIVFLGLYPFPSVADASKFGQDWRLLPEYAKALPRLAGVRGKYHINFGEGDGRWTEPFDPAEAVSPGSLWERLFGRKERFLIELRKGEEALKDLENARAKRKEEEAAKAAAERKRREDAEERRKAEEQRRQAVQLDRISNARCILCGTSLGFLDRMLRHKRHRSCSTYSD